jgi:hypothetical protein
MEITVGTTSMAQLFSLTQTMKIIIVVWVVLTVLVVAILIAMRRDVASLPIVLHLTEELQQLNLHFGVIHVRDGKDQTDHGRLLNEEIPFEPIDRGGTLKATITYKKSLGVQFKCFVDQGPYEYEKIEQMLKNAGFSNISKGEGQKFHIFFILNGKPYSTTESIPERHLNNFVYPS